MQFINEKNFRKGMIVILLTAIATGLLPGSPPGAVVLHVDLDESCESHRGLTRNLGCTVGDTLPGRLRPELTISAWQSECRLSVDLVNPRYGRVKSMSLATTTSPGDCVFLARQDSIVTTRVYRREDNNLEWEIILESRPFADSVRYHIEAENLRFVLQDTALVSEDIKRTSVFPDSTIYSWIAFHRTNRHDYRVVTGDDTTSYRYAAGIAFIIYRPRAFDAHGRSVWCRLDIDTLQDCLTVAVPPEFLDDAIFPVVIDPTIGNTSTGSWSAFPSNWLLQTPYYTHDAPTGNGTISRGYIYSNRNNDNYACSLRCFVYDYSSDLSECDLIASSDSIAVTNSELAWKEFQFNSESITIGNEYIPAFKGYNSGGAALRVAYGIGVYGDNKRLAGSDWSGPSTLAGAESSSEAWSCYFEYIITGDGEELWRRRRLKQLFGCKE